MRNKYISLFLGLAAFCFSQETASITASTKKRGKFYFTWGYTRNWYSKSTIHFEDHSGKFHEGNSGHGPWTANYDFTIYNAQATDRPDFDKIKDVVNVTIPQFVVHAGYYFKNRPDMGIEINYDHAKYIVNDYQKVHIQGQFNDNYVDQDTILNPQSFLHFEHSDGANFVMVNFLKKWKLYNPHARFDLSWVAKGGAGIVYPRTDVTIFGQELNNRWHIAGWIVGAESGLRLEFLKHGVFEFVGKGSFANYRQCLVLGAGNGSAKHSFFCGQLTMVLGFVF